MSSHLALKTVWILISWLLPKTANLDLHCFQEKPADQDPYCLQELIYIWFHTVFERIICLSTERYELKHFFRTSKIFYGQVHFGFLLAPGQAEIFTISTPLKSMHDLNRGTRSSATFDIKSVPSYCLP